ncbi:hypothetical protein DO97_19025 [Neosynechococcus sphagnicola sy1]|uniref:Uncharacterized protein n=1 Tax=Neosynechococcus sphagnicola sy1 TaxID=1497020 RepID=A0A098TS69_9CYAN|nr:hypothetical protein [Neosynechococcus sphagnicola]KGF73573.1 hypothetical protein DO97_19025 [Neosynechococcus sphagnicola sy1]
MEGNNLESKNTNTKSPLELAEYASLLLSVAGTVASALTQQAVLAAAPLSLSLILNLANRRRIQALPPLAAPAALLAEPSPLTTDTPSHAVADLVRIQEQSFLFATPRHQSSRNGR